jgi:tetratricopeptide (TPR) repeat protein
VAQKSEKMTKQELRAPDAFQLYGAEASDWLMKRSQIIGTVAVVVVVGGLIAALVQYFSNRTEERASKQLGQTLQVMERPVVEGELNLQAPPGEEPPFKTQQEKDQAIVKALGEFRAQNKGTDAAVMAALPLGKAEYRLGNYDGALAAFDEFIKDAPKDEPLMVSAYEGQGYAHEAKGQLDKALESFKGMAKGEAEAGDYLQGMGLYHQARILVQQGKKDEAAQVLVDLKTSQANTAAGRLATERLAVLAAEGVKVPEPKTAPPAPAPAPGAPAPAAPQQQ